jgi:hypothetical protein
MTKLIGNMRAPAVRIRPGACSWYHGAVLVESRTTQLHGKLLVIGLKGAREVEEPESEERTGHQGVEEFVQSKVCLFCANSTGQPHGLLESEGALLEAFRGEVWMAEEFLDERILKRRHQKIGDWENRERSRLRSFTFEEENSITRRK